MAQNAIERRTGLRGGTIVQEQIDSAILETRRTASVYTPAGYNSVRTEPYPVLICFHGWIYTTPIPTPTILDNLISDG